MDIEEKLTGVLEAITIGALVVGLVCMVPVLLVFGLPLYALGKVAEWIWARL